MVNWHDRDIGNIVILTGAGISAESGLKTFRDTGGLWENHDPMEIATPEAFARDPDLVYRFYNARRNQLDDVEPNNAHRALALLAEQFEGSVFLVTQNVEDCRIFVPHVHVATFSLDHMGSNQSALEHSVRIALSG